jgi:hypothetical protein
MSVEAAHRPASRQPFYVPAARALSHRSLPALAAILSLLLALPALGVRWVVDDYFHRVILLGHPRLSDLLGPPSDMFRFFRGDPDRTGREIDLGLFPWWTDPTIKAEFLQPLTVLTHRLDYVLWPDSPVLMHAHSLAWLGAMVTVAAVFYRRMLGATWVAGVAALLFALDDARGPTVGFLANRNALVAATFGIAALIAHDRWRRAGSTASAVLAPLLLAAALFAKEEGIATCAYLAAYGLFADAMGRQRGCLALVPYAWVVVIWRVLRDSWGYGVHNVGLYLDPLTDPAGYWSSLLTRIPVLLLGQWGPLPSEINVVLTFSMTFALALAALAFLAIVAAAMFPLLRCSSLARYFGAGTLFAAVPLCATIPTDRLLTFVGLGASGLLAQYWAFVFAPTEVHARGSGRVLRWIVAWFFIVVHAVLGPLMLPFRAGNPLGPSWVEHRLYVDSSLGPALGDKTLVVVSALSPPHAGYVILQRAARGETIPRHLRTLAPISSSVAIRRVDDQTLEIRPKHGYLSMFLDRVFRCERRPLARGDRVRLTGMTVEISDLTPDGRPASATFRFDVPLESPSLLWLCFRGNRFEPYPLPAAGETVVLEIDWPSLLWHH